MIGIWKTMTLHFLDRGYPIDLLHESAIKDRRLNQNTFLHPSISSSKTTTDWFIMLTIFHPSDDSLRCVVKKNWLIWGKSHSTNPVFNRKPLTAYRRLPNLKDTWFSHTVRLKPVTNRQQGCSLSWTRQKLQPAQARGTGTKQTIITQFFKKCLTTSSSSLTDLTPRVDLQVHKSQSIHDSLFQTTEEKMHIP